MNRDYSPREPHMRVQAIPVTMMPEILPGCEALWTAVLRQAIQDAIGPKTYGFETKKHAERHRESALAWFGSAIPEPWCISPCSVP